MYIMIWIMCIRGGGGGVSGVWIKVTSSWKSLALVAVGACKL